MIKKLTIAALVLSACGHYQKVNPNLLPAETKCLADVQRFDLDAISESCSACLKSGPSAVCYNGVGIVRGMRGDTQESLRLFKEAIKTDPNFAQAHNNLGVIYFYQKKVKEACESFGKAVELDPGYTDAKDNLRVCQNAAKASK